MFCRYLFPIGIEKVPLFDCVSLKRINTCALLLIVQRVVKNRGFFL
jgi:hypothetical protein